jgi:hypothetical protein
MYSSFLKLPLEMQVPFVALMVLHWIIPLRYFAFEEARLVLRWAFMSYLLMHNLMHFSGQSKLTR